MVSPHRLPQPSLKLLSLSSRKPPRRPSSLSLSQPPRCLRKTKMQMVKKRPPPSKPTEKPLPLQSQEELLPAREVEKQPLLSLSSPSSHPGPSARPRSQRRVRARVPQPRRRS